MEEIERYIPMIKPEQIFKKGPLVYKCKCCMANNWKVFKYYDYVFELTCKECGLTKLIEGKI